MTASVRLVTSSAFKTAVTWFLTVGSARSRARPIALLLLPCIIRASTSTCLSVSPRSRGEVAGLLAAACPCAGFCGLLLAAQNFGWDIDPTGKYQADGAQQNSALSGLGDEPQCAEIERPNDVGPIVMTGEDYDRDGGVALANLGEHLEAVAVRQAEVEQDKPEVRLLGDAPHRLMRVRRLHDNRIGLQLAQNPAQRLADQDMIVDNKKIHIANPAGTRSGGYINPGSKALGRGTGQRRQNALAHNDFLFWTPSRQDSSPKMPD